MDLSTLANLINAFAVTAALIFAGVQISHYRQRRRHDAMLELVRSFQSPTFSKALRRVTELPGNACAEEIRKLLGTDGEDLVVHLAATWETIGVLLFHGELTLDIIDDFFSGPDSDFVAKTAGIHDRSAATLSTRHMVGVVPMAGRTHDGA